MAVVDCTAVLVGRAEELDRLGAAFDVMAGGRASTVLVGGDAGIGKSRLVEEFSDQARLRGAVVATGMCIPADGLPYAPVLGILRDLGRELGRAPAGQLLGALGAADGSPATDPSNVYSGVAPVTDTFARTAFFESILEQVVELAQRAPVLLVFEDLQWADSGSTQLIDFLTRNLGDARVLIVGTYRSEEVGPGHPVTPWLTELSRHARVARLDLSGLDRSEVATLVHASLGRQPQAALLESIWNRSQGNPFFAEELLAAGDASAALPMALHAVIISRVRELSPSGQEVVEVAAAAGAAVDHGLLADVTNLDAESLSASLKEAIDKKILVIDTSRSGYQFRHALLREAVYDALLPAQRSLLHRDIATALAADASLGPDAPRHRVAELAWHWWAAGDWARALVPSLRAADAAIELFAFPEAIAFLERAVLAVDRVPAAATEAGIVRAELLERAADVAYLAGSNVRAVELARAAVDAFNAPVGESDPLAVARCHTLLGRNLWGVGDSTGAFAAYRTAIDMIGAERPSVELARALAEEARGLMLMSLHHAGHERALEAIAAAQAAGARDVEGNARNTLGCCLAGLGHYDEGIELVRSSLVVAEELLSPDDLNRGYANLSHVLLDAGRYEEAASIVFDSLAVGEELWGIRLNGAATNSIEALLRLGRWAEADAVLTQLGTAALGVCLVSPFGLPIPIMIRRGEFDEAKRNLAICHELTDGLGDVQLSATVHTVEAELALEQGRPDEAFELLEKALALSRRSDDETTVHEVCATGTRALADRAEAARARRAQANTDDLRYEADRLLGELRRRLSARSERGGARAPRSLAFAALATAERSRLDRSDPDLWAEAARSWSSAREPYYLAYCRWREAEALLEGRVGRARAGECLDEAWHVSRELGAAQLSTRIQSLAQRARLELSDADAEAPSEVQTAADLGLTGREVEILGQLTAGRSDREIGDLLFISKKTVSVHVSNVLRKLDVANRIEAGKIGQAHGLAART